MENKLYTLTQGRNLRLAGRLLLSVMALLLFANSGYSQVSSYSFAQTTGTYTEITGGTLLASGSTNFDDNLYSVSGLPLSFTFNGVSYTAFSVNTNGYITFGATTSSGTGYTPISATTAYAGAISAWGSDHNGFASLGGRTSSLRWEVVGTSPNREVVVQWKDVRPAYSISTTTVPYINYQIRLSETTNVIKIVYGPSGMAVGTTNTSRTPQIGLRGASNTDFSNRTNPTTALFTASTAGGSNSATQSYSSVNATPGRPTNGLTYTWTPPVPCSSLPSLDGGTATATVTTGCVTVASSTLSVTGATGGAAGLTFQWRSGPPGGPYTTNLGTSATQAVSSVTTTTAYVRDIICADGSTIATSSEVIITINPLPTISVTASNGGNFCGSGTLTASGANTYAWQPAASLVSNTGATVTSIATANTTYTVVGTDANGCTNSQTQAITYVTPDPVSLTASPENFCGTGGTTTLSATSVNANYTYMWYSLNGAVISNVQPNSVEAAVTQTSAFQMTATDATTGCVNIQFQSIGVYPLPSATMSITPSTPQCPGVSVTVNSGLVAGNFSVASCPFSPSTAPSSAGVLMNNGVAVTPLSGGSLDDGGWAGIPIGFNFDFFGTTFNSLAAGTNGLLMFGPVPGYGTSSGQLGQFSFTGPTFFPNTSNPGNVIALLAADLNLGSNTTNASLRYWTEGYAPNRIFVIAYTNVNGYLANPSATIQCKLFETLGTVEIHITSKTFSNSAIIGLQDVTKTIGATAPGRSGGTWTVTTPEAWRFSPPSNYTTTWSTGVSGSNLFDLQVTPVSGSTTYSLIYENQTTGCSNNPGTATITYTALAPVSTADITPENPSACIAGPITLTVTPTDGTSPYTYQWYDPSSTVLGTAATQSVGAPGTYSVVVTDACNSSATFTTAVALNPGVTEASISPANPEFCSGSSVTLSANPTGGVAPYSYSWTPGGQTTASITVNTPGSYSCQVSDVCGGLVTTTSVTVIEKISPVVSLAPTPATALICGTGSVDIVVTGDADSYAWTPATGLSGTTGTLVIASPTSTTTYTVTGTGTNGCTTTATQIVTVAPAVVISSVTATPAVICAGQTAQLLASLPAPSSYCTPGQSSGSCGSGDEYIAGVNFGSGLINQTSTCAESLPAGYTNYTAVSAPVTAGTSYPISVSNPNYFSGDQCRVWVDWNQNGLFTDADETYILSGTTTFTGSVSVPAGALNGSTRMRVQVLYNSTPTPCNTSGYSESEDYTLVVSGGASAANFTWDNASSLSSTSIGNPVATPAATTTYTVTVEANGCSTQGTVEVIVNPVPTASSTAGTIECLGGTTTVNVSATGGTAPYTGIGAFTAGVGSYSYTVTDANGCTSATTGTLADGNPAVTYYQDADGDGFGNGAASQVTCTGAPAGYITNGTDCDDDLATVYPGATELCNNIDDDCNTLVDDNTPALVAPASISGTTSACLPGIAGSNIFSVAAVANATAYAWSVPSGMTVSAGQGGASMTASWTAAAIQAGINGQVCVTASNNCVSAAPVCSNISYQIAAPITPGSISGPGKLCPGETATFSIAPVARAASYNWTLPATMSLVSGEGSNIVTVSVLAGYSGGTISVSASNVCGTGGIRSKSLVINNPITPSAINGPKEGLCNATGIAFNVPAVANATGYDWAVSTGTIVSGQNTSAISVDFGQFSSATITVAATNGCGTSLLRSTTLKGAPGRPVAISGSTTPCTGDSLGYSVATVTGATTYTWAMTSGGFIAAGNSTKNIGVKWLSTPSINQSIAVYTTNACGSSLNRVSSTITVATCPRLGQSNTGSLSLNAMPNPTSDRVTLVFNSDLQKDHVITLMDLSGRVLSDQVFPAYAGENRYEMSLGAYASGTYIVRVFNGVEMENIRITLEN